MKRSLPLILALALALPAAAQVYTPPATSNPAPNNNPAPRQDSANDSRQNETTSPYGDEIPLLDPSAETVTIAGITIPLGDSRLTKARFEKYLNEPPENSEAARQYRENIQEILDLLSPMRHASINGRLGSKPELTEAFKHLARASAYPGDARLCATLAESVYTAMLARNDSRSLRDINKKLTEESRLAANRADFKVRTDTPENKTGKKSTTAKDGSVTEEKYAPGYGMTSLEYAGYVKRLAEIEALKKTNVAKSETALLLSKTQFQSTLVHWFFQRRFQHVLMGARFYNQIWRDGDQTLKLEEGSDFANMFSGSLGTTPTVSGLDALSSEAIRDTEKAIEAFNFLLERDEIHSASQRLLEAFAIGEYLTPVATLELSKKRKVQGYVRELNLLYGAMQARDYTQAKDLIAKLKLKAKDFPSAKADAAIAGYTLASDLAVEQAKAHLLAKDTGKASESIKEAAEIWPTNPKLQEFSHMVGSTSELVQSRNDFDRLLSEGNYREIARRAEEGEFIMAVRGDDERQDALRQIRDNLRSIEVAISKANEFSKVGADYAAYEQLARLRKDFPDDPKLGREIELLAPRVADFTKSIDRAEKLKSRREPEIGSAMAHYLQAQSIYPNSEIAREGIDELLKEMLR